MPRNSAILVMPKRKSVPKFRSDTHDGRTVFFGSGESSSGVDLLEARGQGGGRGSHYFMYQETNW